MTIAVERYGGGRNKSVVDLAENCRVLFLDIVGLGWSKRWSNKDEDADPARHAEPFL